MAGVDENAGTIPAYPGKKFEVGTPECNALLSHPEYTRFAEMLAMHKASWGIKILKYVRAFHGATGEEGPLPSFVWAVADVDDFLKSRIDANTRSAMMHAGKERPSSPGHDTGPDKVLPPGQQSGGSGAAGGTGQGASVAAGGGVQSSKGKSVSGGKEAHANA